MTTPMELSECAEVVELVTAYLEGELRPAEAEAVATHLGQCPGCTAYFLQVQQTASGLLGLETDTLPAHLREDLLAAFRDYPAQQS